MAMGLFRPSRARPEPDPHLRWKMTAFVVGAAFGLVGMMRENGWLLGIGIAVLAIGVLLRFLPRSG